MLMLAGWCLAQGKDSLHHYGEGHPLAKGQKYLDKSQYGNAADFYHAVSVRFGGTAIGMEALFLEAESYRLGGRYSRAIEAYRKLQRDYPFAQKREEAQFRIAWCQAQRKTPEASLSAVSAADLLLASFPESAFRDQVLALREEAMGRQKILSQEKTATPEALFARAKEHFEQRKYLDAMEGFKEVIYNHPGTRLAAEATFYLGECYFRTKDYQAAIDEYSRLLDDYPTSPFADDAQYMIAYGYFKQSPHYALDQKETGDKAKEATVRFFERFPESPLAPDVRQLQSKIDDKLARKEYEAGRIYFKMKNPKSARIYFNYVLEKYQNTVWAQKSRDYLARLDREYPADRKVETSGQECAPSPEK
jgi:outer membrane assembly lipoprotein YfiO